MSSPDMSSTEVDFYNDLSTIFDQETCVRKGLCPVTQIRHEREPFESHSLYFEQHGSGPTKVLFIMGLNGTSFGWLPQVQHFGQLEEYSVLVFDNRGVGHSGSPRGPYTTSEMAEDALVLLKYVGWTEKHDLNVVGTSLGGMIAQELAARIPEQIISLTLVVTTPGGRFWNNLPPWRGAGSLARLMTMKDPKVKIPVILEMLFPTAWLDEKDEDDPTGRTNREVQNEIYLYRFSISAIQPIVGSLSQMSAALTHHVSPSRLRSISSSIPKVLLITGDVDNLVDPRHSRYMKSKMPEAELVEWEGTGHGINAQRKKRFNVLLERVFKEGRERLADSS